MSVQVPGDLHVQMPVGSKRPDLVVTSRSRGARPMVADRGRGTRPVAGSRRLKMPMQLAPGWASVVDAVQDVDEQGDIDVDLPTLSSPVTAVLGLVLAREALVEDGWETRVFEASTGRAGAVGRVG